MVLQLCGVLLSLWIPFAISHAGAKMNKIDAILTTEAIVKDPLQAKGYQQFQVLNLFLDTLVRKSPETGIVSSIAKRWEVSANQETYTFHLSEQATFQNGEKVIGRDVLFSFERHLKEGSAVASYLKNVLVEIVSPAPDVVVFRLKGPYPPFLELISMAGFGIISHKSTSEKIVGSGPYAFEFEDQGRWCLRKRADYKFKTSNVGQYCFRIERDIEKTVDALNSGDVNLAMGSPLEVALSKRLKANLVSSPTFSLVATHVVLNQSNKFFSKRENRKLVADIARFARSNGVLTKFDNQLDTYIPRGIMPESYYRPVKVPASLPHVIKKEKLKLVFPYGIFLEDSVHQIVNAYERAGFEVSYVNVKGKDLLQPILEGKFDLLFVPYQGVVADPDGYLDLLEPKSVLSKAQLPTAELLANLVKSRFGGDKTERLQKYQDEFQKFDQEDYVIPFSQNSIPIVYNKMIRLPNLDFSFHLNLRELNIIE